MLWFLNAGTGIPRLPMNDPGRPALFSTCHPLLRFLPMVYQNGFGVFEGGSLTTTCIWMVPNRFLMTSYFVFPMRASSSDGFPLPSLYQRNCFFLKERLRLCFNGSQLRVSIIPYRLAVRIPAIGGGLHVLFEFPGFFRCHGRSRIGIDTMVRWLTTLFTNR